MFLTEKQFHILEFMKEFRQEKGYSPTLEEIAQHFGVSKITIHEHVLSLEQKGAITRQRHRARSIEFPDEIRATRKLVLPLKGYIQAGQPIEAVQQEEEVDLASILGTQRQAFLLRVKGDSMIEEQIRDGDYVIVEQRRIARNGETVVALLENGEATLKKYYKEPGRIRLQPANRRMKPVYATEVRIQGVVIGVFRRCE